MSIDTFMAGYKRAWEGSDEHLLASLFAPDGVYRNTPFAEQRGHDASRRCTITPPHSWTTRNDRPVRQSDGA